MRLLISLAAAVLLLVPISVKAVESVKTISYRTAYSEVTPFRTGGEYPGLLTLRFSPDGTVSGRYRDEFSTRYETVAGGSKGNQIWFSFGRRRFHGTIERGGAIKGTLTNVHGPNTYAFTAQPAQS